LLATSTTLGVDRTTSRSLGSADIAAWA
jgi:hypothetical protein